LLFAFVCTETASATVYGLSITGKRKVDGTKYKKGHVAAYDDGTQALSHSIPPGMVGGKEKARLAGQSADLFGRKVGIDGLSVVPAVNEPFQAPALSLLGHTTLVVILAIAAAVLAHDQSEMK
jgi:hypothetical protein